VAEIERVAKRLALPAGVQLHKLHGSADPAEQRAAVVAGRHGRACILATAIAETSLTLDGVRIVVDSGLARRARFDRASGLSRLATEKASQAAVAQRAGRAGRQGPGVAIRLWDEGETRARPPFDPPEIAEVDLSSMLLGLATFGVTDPATLRWLDPPTPAALADARTRLRALGAIDGAGHLVPHGRLMARLPLAPPLAHMLLEAARRGAAANAARLALLVEERGLGGRSSDIEDRMEMFNRDRSGRAEAARRLADRWAATADGLVAGTATGPTDTASLLALAYPDRVARRRIATGAERPSWQMAGGPAVWLDGGDPLARSEWLVVADATGAGPDARLALGAAFDCSSIGQWVAERAETVDRIEYDAGAARMVAERVQMLGALQLGRAALAAPGREALAQAWLDRLRACGLDLLQWPEAERQLRQRIGFARAHGLGGLPSVDAAALLDRAHEWLLPLLEGVERLDRVSLEGVIASMLDHPARSALDRFAPPRFITPAGTSHSICYRDGVLPEVEVRIQAMFGLAAHPTIACGRVPLMLALTSPAGRIVQKTTDLGAFWSGSWADVRREMRGRYPRHPWPEDPATAPPTTRSKRAAAIGG
jgi:ATP-dependent helicase HrpB